MKLVVSTSVALFLTGLYYAYSSYLGFTRSVEMCQHYHCGFVPTFPLTSILWGLTFILLGVGLYLFKNIITGSDFLEYKKKIKGLLSIILVFTISWLHLKITNPCSNSRIFCDYYVGFPVRFWVVTDYLDTTMMLGFFVGILLDYAIWFFVLSVFFTLAKKLKKQRVNTRKLRQ